MVFPVVMYGCESWTVKKAERWRIGAFELWCWRRLLRVPWTTRRYNQSILKEISPGCFLEGMMLKLKLQYFRGCTREDEMAGWHHWLDGHESEWTPGVGDGQGGLACCDSWGHKRVGHDWATGQQQNHSDLQVESPNHKFYYKMIIILSMIICQEVIFIIGNITPILKN